MPSLRPPIQKNFSPAPVSTRTRVRVSRRIASMQSRTSWHMTGVNMLPSSGRFSVNVPTGPSSSYTMVSYGTAVSSGGGTGGACAPPALHPRYIFFQSPKFSNSAAAR